VFQDNPVTGDRRTSGSLASLAGLEDALASGDPALVDLAIRRILLGHALIFGYDGIPLLYMGDELGQRNDHGYLDDPALAADNRWLHRPAMDWELAGRRSEDGTVERRIFSALAALAAARRATPQLHAATPVEIADLQQPQLLAFLRRHPLGTLVAVHNVTEQPSRSAPWPCTWSATTGRSTASPAARPGSSTGRSCWIPTRRSGSPPRRDQVDQPVGDVDDLHRLPAAQVAANVAAPQG
jgi:amylosucrase